MFCHFLQHYLVSQWDRSICAYVSELYILAPIYWQSFSCFHRPAHHPVILSMSCQISGNHQAAIAPYMPAHNKTSAYIHLQFRKQSGIFAGLIVKSPVVIIGISHTELDGSHWDALPRERTGWRSGGALNGRWRMTWLKGREKERGSAAEWILNYMVAQVSSCNY